MGIFLDDEPVFEGTRLALVRIYAQIDRLPDVLGDKSPFNACRKACASTAAETRLLQDLDDFIRLKFPEGLAERLVSSERFVNFDVRQIRDVNVLREYFHRLCRQNESPSKQPIILP